MSQQPIQDLNPDSVTPKPPCCLPLVYPSDRPSLPHPTRVMERHRQGHMSQAIASRCLGFRRHLPGVLGTHRHDAAQEEWPQEKVAVEMTLDAEEEIRVGIGSPVRMALQPTAQEPGWDALGMTRIRG